MRDAARNGNYVVTQPELGQRRRQTPARRRGAAAPRSHRGRLRRQQPRRLHGQRQVGSGGRDGALERQLRGHGARSGTVGALINAGAVTWSSGTTGVTGIVSAANSLVGTTASTSLQSTVVDNTNYAFFGRFVSEGGGRVRVESQDILAIVSAVDIPSDQGGWLRLTFNRFGLDVANSSPQVTSYGVWRHVPGTLIAGAVKANASAQPVAELDAAIAERLQAALSAGLDAREVEGRLYVTSPGSRVADLAVAFPPGTWEQVANVFALQSAQYVVAVPTISNAAADDFVVTVHTTTPSTWFVSQQASGQSIDNLAPAPPTMLTGAYSGGQTNLDWAANTENDLDGYRVYRGNSAGFIPGPGNLIASPTSPSHSDVGPAGSYYKVSAMDVNDNESGFTLITPGQTTAVGGEGPVAFALDGVRPNPASGNGLNVAFALPTGAAARLELLDVSGRRVLAREVGSLGVGRHTVNLSEGRRVAPGLYWVRLTQARASRAHAWR